MRLFYKGLALAFAAGMAGYAAAKTDIDSRPMREPGDSFTSPFASAAPRSAFASDPIPMAKPGHPSAGTQVTPVPEPGEWALMAAGLALVGIIARRKRQKKNP